MRRKKAPCLNLRASLLPGQIPKMLSRPTGNSPAAEIEIVRVCVSARGYEQRARFYGISDEGRLLYSKRVAEYICFLARTTGLATEQVRRHFKKSRGRILEMVASANHIFRAGFRPSGFLPLHLALSIWPLCFLTGVIWRVSDGRFCARW